MELMNKDLVIVGKRVNGESFKSMTMCSEGGDGIIYFDIPVYESGKIYPEDERDEFDDYCDYMVLMAREKDGIKNLEESGIPCRVQVVGERTSAYEKSDVIWGSLCVEIL